MGVNNRDFVHDGNGAFPTASYSILTLNWPAQIPASETDVEYMSVRVPGDSDWQIVEAYVWAKAQAGSGTVNIEDDGTAIGTHTVVVAGAQTLITGVAGDRVKGGSELQVNVTTGGGETIDGLLVTITLRPYPMGEGGQAVT